LDFAILEMYAKDDIIGDIACSSHRQTRTCSLSNLVINIIIIIINNVYSYGGAIRKLYAAGPPYSVKSRNYKGKYKEMLTSASATFCTLCYTTESTLVRMLMSFNMRTVLSSRRKTVSELQTEGGKEY